MGFVKFLQGSFEEILTLKAAIPDKKGKDLPRKISALLRFHFKVNPDDLTDSEYSELWQQLQWVLNFESRRNSADSSNQQIHI